ncbi:glycoside hydrolase family 31 protein [Mucilaginibacter sp. AW1-3]
MKKIGHILGYMILMVLIVPVFCYAQNTDTYSCKKQKNRVVLRQGNRKLSVQFIDPAIVRVQFVPEGTFKDNGTDVCIPRRSEKVAYTVQENENSVILRSTLIKLTISKRTGSLQYFDRSGKLLLAEDSALPRITEKVELRKSVFNDAGSKVEKTANGDQVSANITAKETAGTALKVRQQFSWQNGEALYGLGSHQEDHMNLRGTMQYLYEYNLKKSMPVLLSTKGYGMLFDAGSAMVFHDDTVGSFVDMLAVNQLDYYFMYGPGFDQVIHHFRSLTGKVELPPKYMFGYIQSKERYANQHEVDSVFYRFRSNRIPLDVIVQDWLYWRDGLWGYKKFDDKKYPDPAKMISQIHQRNGHFMLSIWPQMASNEETEMGSKGFILGRKIYDAYNPAARKMYWDEYVDKNLFVNGVDAWWPDSSEPVEADWNRGANSIAADPAARFEKNVKTMADLLGEERVNTYSLHHTMGIYENQRKANPQKRVVILTRASYPGQQRYGTMVWNGDTKATWNDFKSWIPGGLNYMVTGSPYWTIDAGAFFVRSKAEWFSKGDFAKGPADTGYREFYVRNLQYAGWLPVLRSHGTDFAREPWQFGHPGEPFYDAIIKQIELRYRLLPYIYSVAARVTYDDYTMTRSLLFDFSKDMHVYDLRDEFMFGHAFLVCPITDPLYFAPGNKPLHVEKNRRVYLPAGTAWIDFWTGKPAAGGQTIMADAPIDHIPVFVRAGAIVPMGPIMEYAGEKPGAPWEIRIYPGSNGMFTVYEDGGNNYDYQKGASATYTFSWNDKKKDLLISGRTGTFTGITKKRKLNIVLVTGGRGTGLQETTGKIIEYTGRQMVVKCS